MNSRNIPDLGQIPEEGDHAAAALSAYGFVIAPSLAAGFIAVSRDGVTGVDKTVRDAFRQWLKSPCRTLEKENA